MRVICDDELAVVVRFVGRVGDTVSVTVVGRGVVVRGVSVVFFVGVLLSLFLVRGVVLVVGVSVVRTGAVVRISFIKVSCDLGPNIPIAVGSGTIPTLCCHLYTAVFVCGP